MAEEFLIELGVDFASGDKKLAEIRSNIESMSKSTPIKLKLDDSQVKSQLKSIKTQIEALSNVKVNLSGIGLSSSGKKSSNVTKEVSDVTNAYKELMSLQQRMSSYGKELNHLDTKKDVQQISELESKISDLSIRYDDLFNQFGKQLSTAQLDSLNRVIETTNERLDIMSSKMADDSAFKAQQKAIKDQAEATKASAKEINDVYEEIISTIKEMGSIEVTLAGLDPKKNANKISELNQQFSELYTKYENFRAAFNERFDLGQLVGIEQELKKVSNSIKVVNAEMADDSALQKQKVAADEINQSFARLSSVADQMAKIELKLVPLRNEGNSSEIATLTQQLETFRSEYAELSVQLNGKLSTSQLTALGQSFSDLQNKLDALASKAEDARIKLANSISTNIDNGQLEAQSAKLDASLDKIKVKSDEVTAGVERLKIAETELRAARDSDDAERIIHSNEEYKNALQNVKNQIEVNIQAEKKLAEAQKETQNNELLRQQRKNLSLDMDIWLRDNSVAAKEFGAQIQRLQVELETCDKTRLNGIKAEFQEIQKQANLAGQTVQTLGDRFKTQLSKLTTYVSAAMLISYGMSALRSMYDNVLSVDTAMTELYRVTDLTTQQYSDMYDKMAQSAKNYGATLDSIITSTASWVRLGFNPNDAERLSEISAMYQHVTDLDEETAVKNLVTAYKGFEQQLLTLTNGDTTAAIELVADIYDKLGNEFAESAADVGNGLAKSAAVLQQGGNSIQQSAAMFTGIQEVLQDSGVSGSTLKILALRLRGMKGELQELGEEVDDNVESISKMQTQILNFTHGKVNIFNDDGSFKSTYEIMQGIAEIYDDLTDTDRADLLETIAGKNRAVGVQALISNWSQVEKAFDAATNAEGTAAAEQEKYMASLQGHINQLSSAWQAFSNTFLKSNFLKGAVDTLTSIINLLDKLVNTINVVPTLIGAISTAMAFKNVGELIKQFYYPITLGNKYAHKTFN